MRTVSNRRHSAYATVALALVLGLGGCGLEEVEIPPFEGPSELALAVSMRATPDQIVADGFSTSLVTATVFDENGRPLAGREIFFAVSSQEAIFQDLGHLRSTGPDRGVGTGLAVRTDGGGNARVVYVAPPRTDQTANSSILVSARPVGEDFDGAVYRTVRIELRSAEPRLFPNPGGDGLSCGFIVEAPNAACVGGACTIRANTTIGFQTTSLGDIVRYEWFFGDGSFIEHGPDQAHVFRVPGVFTVTHVVTSRLGAQAACQVTMTVIP
jgi:hypothetical protein